MKEIFEKMKKYWITVWLIAAAASFLLALSSYAIYTRITIAKRVVSTQAGIGSLFSSDRMSVGTTRSVEPFIDNTRDASVPVNVFNYVFPKESVFRSDVTEYELKVSLGYYDSNSAFQVLTDPEAIAALRGLNYSISHGNEIHNFADGVTYTFQNCSIPGGAAHSDLFTVVFDKLELGNTPNGYVIEMEASPYDSDLPKIKGYISVRFSKQASAGWSGEIEELDTDKINEYDGYNYYLEGNGKGYLTFRWKKDYLTINKQFLANKENEFYVKSGDTWQEITTPVEADLAPGADGMVSVSIKVDSNKTNRYEVQFFKVDPSYSYTKEAVEGYLPNTNPEDWEPETE